MGPDRLYHDSLSQASGSLSKLQQQERTRRVSANLNTDCAVRNLHRVTQDATNLKEQVYAISRGA